MPFAATQMGLEIITLSKSEKDKYHMISLVCGILKNGTNELIYETERDRQRKQINGYQRGKVREEG